MPGSGSSPPSSPLLPWQSPPRVSVNTLRSEMDVADHEVLHGALSDIDIQVIQDSVATLPGEWYLDLQVDERRHCRPRVWIRADELADHRVDAIGIERSAGLVLVTICRDDEDEHGALPNLVYETLEGAIACLRIYLDFRVTVDMANRTRRQGRPRSPI